MPGLRGDKAILKRKEVIKSEKVNSDSTSGSIVAVNAASRGRECITADNGGGGHL